MPSLQKILPNPHSSAVFDSGYADFDDVQAHPVGRDPFLVVNPIRYRHRIDFACAQLGADPDPNVIRRAMELFDTCWERLPKTVHNELRAEQVRAGILSVFYRASWLPGTGKTWADVGLPIGNARKRLTDATRIGKTLGVNADVLDFAAQLLAHLP